MKAKVLSNPKKEWAAKLAPKVKDFLKKNKVEVVSKGADFTVVIGGDGTIFFYKKELEGPVLGIGGNRSFICPCTEENWEECLSSYLSSPRSERRVALLIKAGGKEYRAINDAAILSKLHEMLVISLEIDGEGCPYEGDGIIVSTPTGSTAYAYSSGGPVIEQSLCVFEIVPVAPYKRLFDPMVVGASREISITPEKDAHLVIDGEAPIQVKKGERVRISRHTDDFLYAIPGKMKK